MSEQEAEGEAMDALAAKVFGGADPVRYAVVCVGITEKGGVVLIPGEPGGKTYNSVERTSLHCKGPASLDEIAMLLAALDSAAQAFKEGVMKDLIANTGASPKQVFKAYMRQSARMKNATANAASRSILKLPPSVLRRMRNDKPTASDAAPDNLGSSDQGGSGAEGTGPRS